MKTPEEIAAAIAGSHFDTYQDSAEEVGHPEGQPIVETWPALRECLAEAIRADRSQTIQVGDRVEKIDDPNLDSRTVIAVGEHPNGDGWLWLDFQQLQLDIGDLPTALPLANYRKI